MAEMSFAIKAVSTLMASLKKANLTVPGSGMIQFTTYLHALIE